MAFFEIPMDNSSPAFSFTTDLSGSLYKLTFRRNTRADLWKVSIEDSKGDSVEHSVPFFTDSILMLQNSNENVPEGYLLAIGGDNVVGDAGRFDIGGEVKLYYRTLDDE